MNVKKLQLLLALTLGLLTVAGALMLLETWSSGLVLARPNQSTIHVAPSGADTPGCGGEADPCATIQYAVDQATGGDEIHIATFDVSGTVVPLNIVTTTARYTGTGDNVVVLTSGLTLRGGYVYAHISGLPTAWTPGLVPAPVDGEHTRRALYVSGNVTPTLRLLAFVNGHSDRGGNIYAEDAHVRFVATPILTGNATYGGGLYLKNCQVSFDAGDLDWQTLPGFSGLLLIRNNTAAYGGGIYVEEGAPVLAGLAVYSNTATADGGGLYLQGGRPVVAGGLVMENHAGNRGGGLYLADSVARIAGTAVYSNIAADGAGFYLDGPFAFSEQTIPVIANSYVRHNRTTGSQGGGFYFRQAIAGLVNNVIADNQATDGAAMYLWASSPQLFHNTIAQNDGNSGASI
jgi:predicted outer membrane repeat protein